MRYCLNFCVDTKMPWASFYQSFLPDSKQVTQSLSTEMYSISHLIACGPFFFPMPASCPISLASCTVSSPCRNIWRLCHEQSLLSHRQHRIPGTGHWILVSRSGICDLPHPFLSSAPIPVLSMTNQHLPLSSADGCSPFSIFCPIPPKLLLSIMICTHLWVLYCLVSEYGGGGGPGWNENQEKSKCKTIV